MLALLLTSISLTFDQLKTEYRAQNGCSRLNEDMDVSMFHCSNNEMMEHMTNWTMWLDWSVAMANGNTRGTTWKEVSEFVDGMFTDNANFVFIDEDSKVIEGGVAHLNSLFKGTTNVDLSSVEKTFAATYLGDDTASTPFYESMSKIVGRMFTNTYQNGGYQYVATHHHVAPSLVKELTSNTAFVTTTVTANHFTESPTLGRNETGTYARDNEVYFVRYEHSYILDDGKWKINNWRARIVQRFRDVLQATRSSHAIRLPPLF